MITAVIDKLKTGSIKNVFKYGSRKNMPEPPYVVVRTENDPEGRGKIYRIIGHMLPGQDLFLEDYMFNEISLLLDDFWGTSRHNNKNMLLNENTYTDTIPLSDDGTIAMEREFLMPSRIF